MSSLTGQMNGMWIETKKKNDRDLIKRCISDGLEDCLSKQALDGVLRRQEDQFRFGRVLQAVGILQGFFANSSVWAEIFLRKTLAYNHIILFTTAKCHSTEYLVIFPEPICTKVRLPLQIFQVACFANFTTLSDQCGTKSLSHSSCKEDDRLLHVYTH